MTNNQHPTLTTAVRLYVVAAIATVAALAILSFTAPQQATDHAWGHAIIVAIFAVLLPLRLRSARSGRRSGLRAVGLISATLLVVNIVEALIPNVFPGWMRVEMVCIAALMATIVAIVVQIALRED